MVRDGKDIVLNIHTQIQDLPTPQDKRIPIHEEQAPSPWQRMPPALVSSPLAVTSGMFRVKHPNPHTTTEKYFQKRGSFSQFCILV